MNHHDPCVRSVSPSADTQSRWGRLRSGLLISIGIGCSVLGIALVITMVRPETLRSLSTAKLMGIVGFILMPALTMLSVMYDRKIVKTVSSTTYQQPETQARSRVAHLAHERPQRNARHTRIAEQIETPSPQNASHNAQNAA